MGRSKRESGTLPREGGTHQGRWDAAEGKWDAAEGRCDLVKGTRCPGVGSDGEGRMHRVKFGVVGHA